MRIMSKRINPAERKFHDKISGFEDQLAECKGTLIPDNQVLLHLHTQMPMPFAYIKCVVPLRVILVIGNISD